MGHFTSLRDSTSAEANEIHTLISIHPAFPYIRTSYLYDEMYVRFKEDTDNLSEARLRTLLHITHILDEIAFSLGLIDSGLRYSLPESLFQAALSNPKYKAYSSSVTRESRIRQERRLLDSAKNSQNSKAGQVDHELNAFTSLLRRKSDPSDPT